MSNSSSIIEFSISKADKESLDRENLKILAEKLEKYAPHDDTFDLNQNGLLIARASNPAEQKTYMLSQPGICIVPQGRKLVSIGEDQFEYGETNMVVYAAEIPIHVSVSKASKNEPYLCFVIPIDPLRLSELTMKAFPNGLPRKDKTKAAYVGDTNPKVVKSAIRLMELIEEQEDADLLVPLVIDEIIIRLLRSPVGPSIAQIGITDSHASKVSKAISWLKENYSKPVKTEDLAKIAGMSVSSFHNHFKAITSVSPLQFQKTLRLHEAKNLMMTKMMDVSTAAYEVGYVSPSQFSREYTRFFGASPAKDTGRIQG